MSTNPSLFPIARISFFPEQALKRIIEAKRTRIDEFFIWPIIRFKQLIRNIQNGFWQCYIRKGSRVEMRSRCPCVVLVLSADSSNHRQRRAERGADFLLVFANGWRFDPTATRLEIKCTPLSLSSPGRDLQSSCRRNWFNSKVRPSFRIQRWRCPQSRSAFSTGAILFPFSVSWYSSLGG